MSIESAIKAIHAAGLSDTQSEKFLSNDHLRRIVEVVLSEQWEPIETAPVDGTKFLARTANNLHRVDYKNQNSDTHLFWQERPLDRYTHWMPIPPNMEYNA